MIWIISELFYLPGRQCYIPAEASTAKANNLYSVSLSRHVVSWNVFRLNTSSLNTGKVYLGLYGPFLEGLFILLSCNCGHWILYKNLLFFASLIAIWPSFKHRKCAWNGQASSFFIPIPLQQVDGWELPAHVQTWWAPISSQMPGQ